MAVIHKLTDPFLLMNAGVVRNRDSEPEDIRKALRILGQEMGKQILSARFLVPVTVTTPMNDHVETLALAAHTSIVITTKFDLETFGQALSVTLNSTKVGYMNFEGRRGIEALSAPVREIELPEVRNGVVDAIVIAKSCLATGCTAVSLAKTAIQEYSPGEIIVAAVFYSMHGLREFEDAFPHSQIFIVGDPDEMDDNGLLHPGIGLLEERI